MDIGVGFGAMDKSNLRNVLELSLIHQPEAVTTELLDRILDVPLKDRYRRLNLHTLLPGGAQTSSLRPVITALNILEKYGRNLLSPHRPKFWRSVKFNNPVFKATVDAIEGGRHVLSLYGYTHSLQDGLGFPESVLEPDAPTVAAVTADVIILHRELNLLISNCHPHQEEAAGELLGAILKQPSLVADSIAIPQPTSTEGLCSTSNDCGLCGVKNATVLCSLCNYKLCVACDQRVHSHPNRWHHQRSPFGATCSTKEEEFMSHPSSRPPWQCMTCHTLNRGGSVLCVGCDRPRGCTNNMSNFSLEASLQKDTWECQACTFQNTSSAVLCEVCDRPRLARKPSRESHESTALSLKDGKNVDSCKTGAFPDDSSLISLAGKETHKPVELGVGDVHDKTNFIERGKEKPWNHPGRDKHASTSLPKNENLEGTDIFETLGNGSVVNPWRNSLTDTVDPLIVNKEHGVKMTRPEVWQCSHCTYNNTRSGRVCEMCDRTSEGAIPREGNNTQDIQGPLKSKEEMRQKRLKEDGAKIVALIKMEELCALGFLDLDKVVAALFESAGDVGMALSILQASLLVPFLSRVWEDEQASLQLDSTDRQAVLRRLLAEYALHSWGRAELALSLLQEGEGRYDLQDVVEAVRESQDRDFIKRMLTQECAVCGWELPRNKMRSLTSCECCICPDCFRTHFTVAVKEKHIRDMVCPACEEPDISDEGELLHYFSTLDILLRDTLEVDAYNLFHKKLTERTLMKDPKFLWCTHCSFGFIYERDQLDVKCPQCSCSFCRNCKRPWEEQHRTLSCEDFQNWKRENDAEYQAQGLAVYLQENGITCPHCKFSYALARGGCMHFICSQCRHQFCSGCYNTFHLKNKCTVPTCTVRMSLHAHHPRDCLFYLRDWEVPRLQTLLKMSNVKFNTDPPAGTQAGPGGGCRVMEQKEAIDGMRDEACGKQTALGYAGLCESHYKEYLVSRINSLSLDPCVLYDLEETITVCRRYLLVCPPQEVNEDDVNYREHLLRVLMTEIPLSLNVQRNQHS
ncbi:E3 ubiquitin-protein ligase RNF31 isoform X2 [Pseudophryne corroboree]|uniref:E3 ubiquitin-protein ligase RNF31 isoform X2 n=1 Tax=Pseudophryne corroboree TaxID=495146 RepID=UPI0030816B42